MLGKTNELQILVNLADDPAGDLSALACMVTSLLMG